MTCRTDDQVFHLPDGRRLGFAEYGARGGRPLLFFHGTPGARVLARVAHEVAFSHNVRLIAPERPGFGRSEFQAGRRIADWPDDVAALADALGLDRFAVAGVSGGGPYALACALRLPERIPIVGIVSGMVPLDEPASAAALPLRERRIFALLRRAPWVGRALAAAAVPVARRYPNQAFDLLAARALVPDRTILQRPEIRAGLIDDMREALGGGGHGAIHELVLFSRPWGFRPADVQVPVVLWHGEADAQVPIAIARRLARQIPTCQARFLAGAGHFWLLDHYEEVLATLCPG
jgi:pimeloyl-ACP methyl ester carboxylesterase